MTGAPAGTAGPEITTVTVKCLATLAAFQPASGSAVRLSGAAPCVADLAAALGLPAAKITTILRNGAPATQDTPLADGDAVTFLPTLSGG
ncbi:MoaD/ThiS family protein [Desulfovibrio sulfodismutans]|uniref:MoaD/ThiS family protein n=1 Tax=Desulfolutivibrio sulfodismutans TaxID=63561 RepID=A0A7K3NHX2_9BACT|nr:MoaD/ThiS family protein [Desulfolutivibrio sulfodismutans]NDY55796.1 MoaD/ThiS family protein [Desulfolutivibrio sulfodismutans]QLA13413.1 thiamine S protein [Desulfolutivibrio sulfodismutans DSM 3696]